ncbi:MAG TPA: hypothetical protein VMG12_38480 [Polyangiaceae bacterium]|nr:hypothetical protein [Polyangiaceae bacterium]
MNLMNMGRFGLLPLLAGAVACSDMDPGDDTFSTVYPNLAQAGRGGSEPVGNAGSGGSAGSDNSGGSANEPPDLPTQWACLDEPAPTFQLPTPPPATVNYIVPIADFLDIVPVPGLQVKLCRSVECADGTALTLTQIDPMRPVLYLLQLPYNPNTLPYLQLSAEGYVTMDYYFGGPIVGNPNPDATMFVGQIIPMLKVGVLDGLLSDVGAPSPADPAKGVIAGRTLDCSGQRAAGVYVESTQELPTGAVPWSLSNNNVAFPGRVPTDARGVAGFANVPPGAFAVRGVVPVDGDEGVEFGDHVMRVKAGVITLGEVRRGIGTFGQ